MPELSTLTPDPRLRELLAGYPEDLFSDRFFQSCEVVARYSLEWAVELVQRLEIVAELDRWRSVEDILQARGFVARFATALGWLLEQLAAAGLLAARGTGADRVYRLEGALRPANLAAQRSQGIAIDPANEPTFELLDAAAEVYPAVAQGEVNGEEALFGLGKIGLWLAYFHNDNPTYAVNNQIAAIAAAGRLPARDGLRILEVGAGAGSGTGALLEALQARGLTPHLEAYVVTEISPFFRRRGERELRAAYPDLPLTFCGLDMNQPWGEQDIEAESFDLVTCVNALHVASDLLFTLGEVRRALKPEGWLVAGECMRHTPGQPIYVELVFQILDGFLDVETHPDVRPHAGFLMPENWTAALTRAGFAETAITPDLGALSAIYPRFFTGAVCGRKGA